MSRALKLGCKYCKEYLWVGQSNHLYTAQNHLDALQDFLLKHESKVNYDHELVFGDDNYDEFYEDGWVETEV